MSRREVDFGYRLNVGGVSLLAYSMRCILLASFLVSLSAHCMADVDRGEIDKAESAVHYTQMPKQPWQPYWDTSFQVGILGGALEWGYHWRAHHRLALAFGKVTLNWGETLGSNFYHVRTSLLQRSLRWAWYPWTEGLYTFINLSYNGHDGVALSDQVTIAIGGHSVSMPVTGNGESAAVFRYDYDPWVGGLGIGWQHYFGSDDQLKGVLPTRARLGFSVEFGMLIQASPRIYWFEGVEQNTTAEQRALESILLENDFDTYELLPNVSARLQLKW